MTTNQHPRRADDAQVGSSTPHAWNGQQFVVQDGASRTEIPMHRSVNAKPTPRHPWTASLAAITLAAASVLLSACGSYSSSSTTTTGPANTGTSTSGTPTTTTNPSSTTSPIKESIASVPCPSTGSTTVCEFYSPTRNISCEINVTSALCLTSTPAQSVTLTSDGKYRTCQGQTCLSNAGLNTGLLAYGTSTSNGTFTCVSRQTNMTCTASKKGFAISTSGITSATA